MCVFDDFKFTEFDFDEEDQVSWGSDFDDEEDDFTACYLERTLDGRHSSLSSDRISRCGAYDLQSRFAMANLTLGKFQRVPSPEPTIVTGGRFNGSSSESDINANRSASESVCTGATGFTRTKNYSSSSSSGSSARQTDCSRESSAACSSSGSSCSSSSCCSGCSSGNCRGSNGSPVCACCTGNKNKHPNHVQTINSPMREITEQLKRQLNQQLKQALCQQQQTWSQHFQPAKDVATANQSIAAQSNQSNSLTNLNKTSPIQSTFRPGQSPVLGIASLQCRNNNNCTATGCDRKCQLTRTSGNEQKGDGGEGALAENLQFKSTGSLLHSSTTTTTINQNIGYNSGSNESNHNGNESNTENSNSSSLSTASSDKCSINEEGIRFQPQ